MKNYIKILVLTAVCCLPVIHSFARSNANIPKVKNIRIREVVGGNGSVSYNIIANTEGDANAEVAYVVLSLEALDNSPKPSAAEFKLENSAKNKKRYVNKDITFSKSSLGFEYLAKATMKDAKGITIGESETFWVTVDAKGEDFTPDPCNSKISLDSNTASYKRDEKGNQGFHLCYELELSAGANPSNSFLKLTKWTHVAISHKESATGYIQTITTAPTFNEKTGQFDLDYTLTPSSKTASWDIVDAIITIENPCGDMFYYKMNGNGFNFHGIGNFIDFNVSRTEPDVCSKPRIDSLYWEVGSQDKTTGQTPVFIHFPKTAFRFGYVNWNTQVHVNDVMDTDEKYKGSQVLSGTATLNEKTGWLEATLYFDKAYNTTIWSLDLLITNPCKESVGFTAQSNTALGTRPGVHKCKCTPGYSANKTNANPCNTTYKLKEINYSTSTVSGFYVMQFEIKLDKNSDVPYKMKMVVELKNCDNKSMFISLSLTYDSKKGIYTAEQAITQSKECLWKLHYAEIGAYNPCGDLTWWGLDFSQAKSNGSGTRNVSTTTNGKPGLL